MTHALVVLGVCALPVLLYLPFLTEPFLRDEGFYAAVAQRVLDGGVPYRDAFDNKPPLIYGWYAFSFLVFGENVWAPRLVVAILLSFTSLLVYTQARLLSFSRGASLIAAVAFGLSMAIVKLQTNANTEYFLLLPMTAALVAFTMGHRTGSARWYALAGALGGLAIMTKQVAAFNFVALAALPLWFAVRDGGWVRLRVASVWAPSAVQTAGAIAAISVVCAPFVATGTFGALIDQVGFYSIEYSRAISLGGRIVSALRAPVLLMFIAGPWIVLSIAGVIAAVRSGRNDANVLLVAWLAASAFGCFASGRFYAHYFVGVLPAASLIAAAGLTYLWAQRQVPLAKTVLFGIVPLTMLTFLLFSGEVYLRLTPEARHEAKYPTVIAEWENQGDELGEWLQARTTTDDYIYNLGFQPELYFYAARQSPSRFLFDHPFAIDSLYEAEALADLRANPPAYVVDSAVYEPKLSALNYYPQTIADWVQANYTYLGKVYYADVYALNEVGE